MKERDMTLIVGEMARVLECVLNESPTAREAAERLGHWLIDRTRGVRTAEDRSCTLRVPSQESNDQCGLAVEEVVQPQPSVAAAHPEPTPSEQPRSTARLKLRIGDSEAEVDVKDTPDHIKLAQDMMADTARNGSVSAREPEPDIDLALIAQRCRLKAEGCRLAVGRGADGVALTSPDVDHRVRQLLRKAKALPNCFVWALYRNRTLPTDERLEVIARCYEALADAADLMVLWDGSKPISQRPEERDVVALLAEAHSMLRSALRCSWLSEQEGDRDQNEAHAWLKHRCAVRRIYLDQWMRLDSPADPVNVELVRKKIAMTRSQLDEMTEFDREIRSTLSRIKHHARMIINGDEHQEHHWKKIAESLEALQQHGVQPTDVRIRKALDDAVLLDPPEIDHRAPLSTAIRAARDAYDEPEGACEAEEKHDEDKDPEGQVETVRRWLSGKSIVVIGGVRRPHQIRRIERHFNLAEARWIELREHASGEPMRAPIERADTVLVMVLIKIAGHLHVDQARALARSCHKPCVSVPKGFGIVQIAKAIIEQAGGCLINGSGGDPGVP